jgi:hypothetical protein
VRSFCQILFKNPYAVVHFKTQIYYWSEQFFNALLLPIAKLFSGIILNKEK